MRLQNEWLEGSLEDLQGSGGPGGGRGRVNQEQQRTIQVGVGQRGEGGGCGIYHHSLMGTALDVHLRPFKSFWLNSQRQAKRHSSVSRMIWSEWFRRGSSERRIGSMSETIS